MAITLGLATAGGAAGRKGRASGPERAAAPQAGEGKVARAVIGNEKAVWESVRAKNVALFNRLVADDARIIFDTGILSKADFLRSLPERTITAYSLADFEALRPNADTVILIYRATRSGTFRGKPFPPESVHEATVWVLRGGRWVAVLNQETPILSGEGGS
ncbi:MAG TPA: nuclear transport factor 2 family protein [Candidatus Acidoferrales bacterium]|nr:nuclear transport factor 2 family protein [Candidatus Acidoferrales bacterium]